MPTIKVPAALTGGSSSETIEVDGGTVREAFQRHAEEHGPGLRDSVVENGEIKEFINVYVNGEEVGHLDGLDTPVEGGDRIRVVPAASGGMSDPPWATALSKRFSSRSRRGPRCRPVRFR